MNNPAFFREEGFLKALAHRKRLEIIQLLHGRELTATEIQRMTGFPQANLSQHLNILKNIQVIVATRTGKHIRYRLTHQNFVRILALLQETASGAKRRTKPTSHAGNSIQDMVCGMWLAPAPAHWKTIYKGATYYFCASGCYRHFMKSPESYARR